MNEPNETGQPSWLIELIQKSGAEEERLNARLNDLMDLVDAIKGELRMIERVRKAANPDSSTTRRRRPPGPRSSASRTTGEKSRTRMREMIEFILANYRDGTFTAMDLYETMRPDYSDAQLYPMVKVLRDREFIGRAGSVPGRAKGTTRDAYRIMHPERADELLSEYSATR